MAWPAYARILGDGYGLGRDTDVERTTFDDGLIDQEKRFTSALRTRQVRGFLESDADLVTFKTWAASEAHMWFAWTDTENGKACQVRVRGGQGGISYNARVRGGRRTWDFTLELEGP